MARQRAGRGNADETQAEEAEAELELDEVEDLADDDVPADAGADAEDEGRSAQTDEFWE